MQLPASPHIVGDQNILDGFQSHTFNRKLNIGDAIGVDVVDAAANLVGSKTNQANAQRPLPVRVAALSGPVISILDLHPVISLLAKNAIVKSGEVIEQVRI